MKKYLSLLLTLALVLGLCAVPAAAAPEEFVIEDGVLRRYNGLSLDVTIPEGVTSIGFNAFEDADIRSVTLPESLRLIDGKAFYHCAALRELTIPDTVERIESNAFDSCTSLHSLTLGSGLREIGMEAFARCVSLTRLDLPDGLRSIEAAAFQDCVGLTDLRIPEGVTELGHHAFDSCTNLREVQLPSTLEDLTWDTFRRTPWLQAQGDFVNLHGVLLCYQGTQTDVAIPGTVERIADAAFRDAKIRSVTIPGSVKQIGGAAFAGCEQLERVVIGEGVEEISDYAFHQCYNLKEVSIPKSVTKFGAALFTDTLWKKRQGDFLIVNGVLLGYSGEKDAVVIPDGVKEIAPEFIPNTYPENQSVVEVTIPASVEKVGNNAFSNCYTLERVNYPPTLTDIGGAAFRSTPWIEAQGAFPAINGILLDYQAHERDVVIPKTIRKIADQAFYYASEMVSVTVPGSVREIGPRAFRDNLYGNLRYVVLEEGVEQIGPQAFDLNTVEAAVLPASLQEIAPDAFPKTVTIYAPDGSYAQNFAKTQGWTVYPAGTSLTGFSDVGNQTYCTFPVLWAVKEGITKGTSETTFSPDRPCTQEEAATLLLRILGYAGDPAVFFQGISGGTYDPKAPCTRAKAVTFLFNCLDGYYDGTGSGFADVPDNAPYVGAVRWAVTHNITQGTGPDTFSPDRICTRGQIVTFLYRALA